MERLTKSGSAARPKAIIERLIAIENILGDTYDLSRLKELVEADRQGRCVVLPCKVGSKVYVLYTGWETEIIEEEFTTDMISSFGKYVFLSREAAEKALEGYAYGDD